MSDYFPTCEQWLRIAGRSIVYLVGLLAALALLLVGGRYPNPVVYYAEFLLLLGLASAAPIFFCLFTFGDSGDQWTIRYAAALAVYIVALSFGGLIANVT